jgi:hypothetical protein
VYNQDELPCLSESTLGSGSLSVLLHGYSLVKNCEGPRSGGPRVMSKVACSS